MAQHCGPHFAAHQGLQLVAQAHGHATQAALAHIGGSGGVPGNFTTQGLGAFAHANQCEALTLLALAAHSGHDVDVVVDFGQQDDVGRACNARLQGNPARMAAHGFHDHDPAMAVAGGVDAFQRIGHGGHGGIKTEAALATLNVVVDGFGHAHHLQTPLGQCVGNRQGAVAADGHQRIQPQFVHVVHGQRNGFFAVRRVAPVGGAQHGAAHAHQFTHVFPGQGLGAALHQTGKPVLNPQYLGPALAYEAAGDRADDRVQAWAIAPASEQTNLHGDGGFQRMMISARRLRGSATSSGVGTRGWRSPLPMAVTNSAGKPAERSNAAIALARCRDSLSFDSTEPTRSV